MRKAAAIFAVLFILFLIFDPGYQSCDDTTGKFKSIEVHEESRESLDLSGSDETSAEAMLPPRRAVSEDELE